MNADRGALCPRGKIGIRSASFSPFAVIAPIRRTVELRRLRANIAQVNSQHQKLHGALTDDLELLSPARTALSGVGGKVEVLLR